MVERDGVVVAGDQGQLRRRCPGGGQRDVPVGLPGDLEAEQVDVEVAAGGDVTGVDVGIDAVNRHTNTTRPLAA